MNPFSHTVSRYQFKAKVWLYQGPTPWHFVTLPLELAAEIKMFHANLTKNFGSIATLVTVGKTTWKTSVFTDTKSGSFVLPLKAEIRKKEKISSNDEITVLLEIG